MKNEQLQFYFDSIIIDTMFHDPRITKAAQSSGVVSSLAQWVFSYFGDKEKEFANSPDKIGAFISFLGPGIATALGSPLLGTVMMLAQSIFGFDLGKILESIGSEIKSLVTGGSSVSSEQVNNAVITSVVNNTPTDEPSEDHAKSLLERAEEFMGIKSAFTLREAELFKLAMEDFYNRVPDFDFNNPKMNIKVAAGWFSSPLASFLTGRHQSTKILVTVISFLVKAALAAFGFMAMGDVVKYFTGGGKKSTTPTSGTPGATETQMATAPPQTKFKPNPNYSEESFNGPGSRWMISADINSIDSILISWAESIYPELKGQDSLIRSTNTFNQVVSVIKAYNQGSAQPDVIFIPRIWKSRKNVVDQFMAEVAADSAATPSPAALPAPPTKTPAPAK